MGKKPHLSDFFGPNAMKYELDRNLKKLQYETTLRSIELLNLNKNFPKSSKILDIGCGTGWSMEVLLKSGYENLVGIDLSDDMLEIARKKGFKVFKANIIKGTPFPDNHFNAAISISVINFIVENINTTSQYILVCKKVSNEIYRILKPGGRAVIQFFKDSQLEKTLSSAFKHSGFDGFLVIDDENLRKEKRFFVIDKPK